MRLGVFVTFAVQTSRNTQKQQETNAATIKTFNDRRHVVN